MDLQLIKLRTRKVAKYIQDDELVKLPELNNTILVEYGGGDDICCNDTLGIGVSDIKNNLISIFINLDRAQAKILANVLLQFSETKED